MSKKTRKCHDISLRDTKRGDFNPQRTLSGSLFATERLASIRAVVLAFTANKQTNTLCTFQLSSLSETPMYEAAVTFSSSIHTKLLEEKCRNVFL